MPKWRIRSFLVVRNGWIITISNVYAHTNDSTSKSNFWIPLPLCSTDIADECSWSAPDLSSASWCPHVCKDTNRCTRSFFLSPLRPFDSLSHGMGISLSFYLFGRGTSLGRGGSLFVFWLSGFSGLFTVGRTAALYLL